MSCRSKPVSLDFSRERGAMACTLRNSLCPQASWRTGLVRDPGPHTCIDFHHDRKIVLNQGDVRFPLRLSTYLTTTNVGNRSRYFRSSPIYMGRRARNCGVKWPPNDNLLLFISRQYSCACGTKKRFRFIHVPNAAAVCRLTPSPAQSAATRLPRARALSSRMLPRRRNRQWWSTS